MGRVEKGLTLIEILIVLTLLMILGAIVAPNIYQAMPGLRLDGVSRRIMSDIRYTQQIAITAQSFYSISFDVGGQLYRVYDPSTGQTVPDPTTHKDLAKYFGQDDFKDVNLVSAQFPLGSAASGVTFNALGAPTFLGGEGQVVVRYVSSSEQRTIKVAPITGRVKITSP